MQIQSPTTRVRPAAAGSGAPRVPLVLVIAGLVFFWVAFRSVSDLDVRGARLADESAILSIYDSPDVKKAPDDPRSGSFSFTDARGTYERREFTSGNKTQYVNVIHTRKGHMRSGDIHKCEQLNHIVFGRVTLTELIGKREVSQTFVGGDAVRVPAHVPHLYFYEEDTLMTETWRTPSGEPCEFEAWFYLPFRNRIPTASTQHRFDAAASPAGIVS